MRIAIIGKMCSGKSTLANIIKNLNPDYKIYSFGQKVKDVATDLFDMQEKDRSLLIKIGGHMRNIDKDVWVNYVMKQIGDNDNCIIDDIRYQNEVDACIKHGFEFIQLYIPLNIQIERIKVLYPNNYEDHIKNIDDNSENNKLIVNDLLLTIDTSITSIDEISNMISIV